ncbi:MAG: cyclic 2,3-diphosphoglycerate synthase [Candidatus Marsarchaeota archaeon]|jgi:predicted GTPase|nr:cyclic 2,3-diphosphoglycerate synthase [Candidatus Marsarchaeota archaeon]MCL5418724.1 cyclic 2,3-diphosphoglycerate synthase [Candidatus Marsarchaeota archaeon]
METKNVIIIGAAGRDFHDFNVLFRNDNDYNVVAFTAAQIPFISDRMYPKELSGALYPKGIKIYDESMLAALIKQLHADICVQAYSDLQYAEVMHKASIANANGADFWLVAPERTMLKSSKPVIAVCAVRTGSGKSQTTRYIARALKRKGLRAVIIRHPMPYGVLKDQVVERFAKLSDLTKYKTTIEEREDYEPHIRNGFVVYAGVDYENILRMAEKEADVIIWDGGNNDAPFIKPDLMITIADPLRAGNELSYYPGETVARMADLLVINKANSASKDELNTLTENLKSINPKAKIITADSVIMPDNPHIIKGRSVLIVEDGPTITHGGMRFGAGTVAAKLYKAGSIVSAKDYAVGLIKETFKKYPLLDKELPAMGYSGKQIRDLESTINRADCDVVISATPTNLRRVLNVNKPIVQVGYELKPRGKGFDNAIDRFAERIKRGKV